MLFSIFTRILYIKSYRVRHLTAKGEDGTGSLYSVGVPRFLLGQGFPRLEAQLSTRRQITEVNWLIVVYMASSNPTHRKKKARFA
jgi:hypothetical protein